MCQRWLHPLGVCCWSSPLSFGCWFQFLRVTRCHLLSPSHSSDLSFCASQSQRCHSLILAGLYLHASPCDLESVSHRRWRTVLLRAHSDFCKCKQLILSRPAGGSALLSVNRHKIMFTRAHNRCSPLTDSTPPATDSFSSTSLVLSLLSVFLHFTRDRLLPVEQQDRNPASISPSGPWRTGWEPNRGPRHRTLFNWAESEGVMVGGAELDRGSDGMGVNNNNVCMRCLQLSVYGP